MKDKLYSIIIPHYDCITGLKRLLDSIPDRDDVQILVVDDGSEDYDLIADLDDFECASFEIYKNTSGVKGAGACRNIGIGFSNGKYMIFADSDDFFTEDAFSHIDTNISKGSETDVFYFKPISQCDISNRESDRHIQYCNLIDEYNLTRDKNILYNFFVPWSKVVSSDFIKGNEIRFDEVIASNDVMFSMRINYLSRKVVITDDVIYCVTRNIGSLTVTKSLAVLQSRFDVEKRRIHFIRTRNIRVNANSFLGIFKNYYRLGIVNVFLFAFPALIKRDISFFPKEYCKLIFNPNKLIRKIKEKKSVDDSRYTKY